MGNVAVQAAVDSPISVMMRIRAAGIGVFIGVFIGLSACSQQTIPAWVNSPVAPTQPLNSVRALEIDSRAVFGGSATRGTITLEQAVAVETSIELAASDGAVAVPSSITVGAGASTTSFPIATHAVPGDTNVRITATLAGRPFVGSMTVWRLGENDLWYERSNGALAHFTSENATFRAQCSGTVLNASVNDVDLIFGAPTISKLRVGRYEDARSSASNVRPLLRLLLNVQSAVGCATFETLGSFSIDELQVSRNTVRRFIASFEHHCPSNGNSIRGGVRLTNVPPSTANLIGCD